MIGNTSASGGPARPAGTFITFEGCEGAGKTTQARLLTRALIDADSLVLSTREPGGELGVGKMIRGLLLDPQWQAMPAKTEALLYAADRSYHVATTIRPALHDGVTVICDRFHDSTIAYQGMGRGLGTDVVELSMWAAGNLRPDLVFVLDIDPADGLERVGRRGTADRLEAEPIGFHQRVRAAFLQIAAASPDRYTVLDATRSEDDLHSLILKRVLAWTAARDHHNHGKAPA